jgi:starch synthase (maltosyl-transferring)
MNMQYGQCRVVIEDLQPRIDDGRYSVKRVPGESVDVTADIFADGHDVIRAELLYRTGDVKTWSIKCMKHQENDRWHASFLINSRKPHLFTVRAWVDPLETWYRNILKKIQACLDVQLEMQEGAMLLEELVQHGHPQLKRMALRLRREEDYEENLKWIESDHFSSLMEQYPFRRFEVTWTEPVHVTVDPPKALFSTWYELFPRSASLNGRHGTFRDVIRLLPRIQAMGFDVLYLPPIHPIGRTFRKGKNNSLLASNDDPGSPWAIGSEEGGHKAIHPRLGTLEEFRLLINKAKEHNIDIALDLAFQCSPDHPYVREHPQWFKRRPDGSIQYAENPPKKYQDIYPFYFECDDWENLWYELLSVVLYWVQQGVSIFRVDNPHTKPFRFWQWLITRVHEQYPDVIFLSEAFTRPKIMAKLAKIGFAQSYTYFTWRVYKDEIIAYMRELVESPMRNYFRPNFWPNTPDILPFHLQHQGENMFIIRLALASTLSSNYGIYGPVYEFCVNTPVPGKEEYLDSEKYEIKQYDWKKTNRLTDIITLINQARRSHPALQSTWNITFCTCHNPQLIAYVKYTDDLSDIVLVVINLDAENRQWGYVELPCHILKLTDNVYVQLHDLISGEHYTWTQEWNYVELDPHRIPFHLFHLTFPEPRI